MSRCNRHEMFHLKLEQKCVKVQQARRLREKKKSANKILQMFVAISDKNNVDFN